MHQLSGVCKLATTHYNAGDISDRTRQGYLRDYERLTSDEKHTNGVGIDITKIAKTTAGISTYKSALLREMYEFRRDADLVIQTGQQQSPEQGYRLYQKTFSTDRVVRMAKAVNLLIENPFFLGGVNITRNRRVTIGNDMQLKQSRELNRKRDIDNFELDWQWRVFQAVPPKQAEVFATLSLTGCRPEEMWHDGSKGVEVTIRRDTDGSRMIDLTIQNAKVRGSRTITHFVDDNQMARCLYDKARANGGTYEVMKSPKALREYIRRNRDKWDVNRSDLIVGYSWRYAMATSCSIALRTERTDDKSADQVKRETTQMICGHWSVETQNYYIRRQSAKASSVVPFAVKMRP